MNRLKTIDYCTCDLDYINSLRTKLTKSHNIEIPLEAQTSVIDMLDERLEKQSIDPPTPGQVLDLDHLDRGVKSDVEKLCDNYSLAWSKGKFDMGEFTAFQADIPTFEGSSSLEKERKLKDHVKREIRPLMDELVRKGIFPPADKQGQFRSNLN